MSRETEKIFKQLMQYMEEHQDELDQIMEIVKQSFDAQAE